MLRAVLGVGLAYIVVFSLWAAVPVCQGKPSSEDEKVQTQPSREKITVVVDGMMKSRSGAT